MSRHGRHARLDPEDEAVDGRRRRFGLGGVVVLVSLALVAAGLWYGFGDGDQDPRPRAVGSVSVDSRPVAVRSDGIVGAWPETESYRPFTVADAIGPSVPLFSAPDVPLDGGKALDNPTWEGLAVVFLVLEEQGDWLHVRVSMRPNGTTAWVRRSDVALRTVPNHVLIEVGARRVTVFRGTEQIFQATVAVGTDRTPTPLGNFFVDGTQKNATDTGAYGAEIISVSGFSNVLQTFGKGIGQIAMHGTNRPELLGQNVSNGCVRMSNDSIRIMDVLAPTGTPVDIVA